MSPALLAWVVFCCCYTAGGLICGATGVPFNTRNVFRVLLISFLVGLIAGLLAAR